MKKLHLDGLDLDLYYEQAPNGLDIYVLPKDDANNIYATFSTRYGSIHNSFIPQGESKSITVNDGIAHFLEHKMFEQPNGVDPFTFFASHGSDANANTSNYKTTYLFTGLEYFKENMNYLLDYVQEPYFTDENVEKEKGIIAEEIKMYLDQPFARLYEGSIYNSFINHPIKYPVIGDENSINRITKEELYKCYNTFYHPSNMFVVITGKVNPEEAINIILENQSKKEYKKIQSIKLKSYTEPDKVAKKYEEIHMDIAVTKVSYNCKINYTHIEKLDLNKISLYLNIWFSIKFGSTSNLVEKLKKEEIITDELGLSANHTNEHIIYMIMADTPKEKELIDYIDKELKNKKVTKEEFERKKKVLLSSYFALADGIYTINDKIMEDIAIFGKVNVDDYNMIKSLNFQELEDVLDKVSLNYNSVMVVKPKINKI